MFKNEYDLHKKIILALFYASKIYHIKYTKLRLKFVWFSN